MVVNQIYSIINSIARQMWGEDAVTVTDLTGLISMGKQVISSANERDTFLGILCDRIGKTVIRTLDLELDFPSLMVNSFEWGAIISKVNVQPMMAKANKSWQIGDNDFVPNQFDIDKPVVVQTFFTDSDTWEFDWTIPDRLFRQAWTNEGEYVSFINGIMSAANDSLVMSLNNMSYLCIDNFIAEKIKANNGIVDVKALYNEQFPNATLTKDECYTSKEFSRYCNMIFKNYLDYMAKPSVKYNTAGMVRATKRDNMHILMNSSWANMLDSYLYSDTYWNDFVKAPNFTKFVSLQGTGTATGNWKTDTSINIVPSSGGEAIVQDGIIAIFADRQAIFTGYEDMFTATDRNNRNRYTNYTSGCTKQYGNDTSENGVIFIIGDDE